MLLSPPFLYGAAAYEARTLARCIADDVLSLAADGLAELEPNLAGGLAGISLFLSAASEAYDDSRYHEAAARSLAKAGRALSDAEISMGLFGGFTGVSWVTQLSQRQSSTELELNASGVPGAPDACAEIDEVLIDYLAGEVRWVPFDLLGGIAGLAVYALERQPRPSATAILNQCVRRLRHSAYVTDRGIAWMVPHDGLPDYARETYPKDTFPLGVAHGLAGVVGALARIVSEAPHIDGARALFDDALAFLLTSRLSSRRHGSFPRLANRRGPVGARAEVVWCWGDPGVAGALLLASQVLCDSALKEIAVETMRPIAQLAPPKHEMVDACLCHGWAGIAHILGCFYEATGEEPFARAAAAWMTAAVRSAIHDDGIGGMYFRVAKPSAGVKMSPSGGILMGSAGVGLALLSATGDCIPGWDRSFLLHGRSSKRAA
jgi:lantibiotic modifying enzyme